MPIYLYYDLWFFLSNLYKIIDILEEVAALNEDDVCFSFDDDNRAFLKVQGFYIYMPFTKLMLLIDVIFLLSDEKNQTMHTSFKKISTEIVKKVNNFETSIYKQVRFFKYYT